MEDLVFGAEPQERWSKEEAAEFEVDVAARLKELTKLAVLGSCLFFVDVLCVIPFLAGFPMHQHWDSVGKYLVLAAMALLLVFVYRWGLVWTAWQSAREVRREFGDPD